MIATDTGYIFAVPREAELWLGQSPGWGWCYERVGGWFLHMADYYYRQDHRDPDDAVASAFDYCGVAPFIPVLANTTLVPVLGPNTPPYTNQVPPSLTDAKWDLYLRTDTFKSRLKTNTVGSTTVFDQPITIPGIYDQGASVGIAWVGLGAISSIRSSRLGQDIPANTLLWYRIYKMTDDGTPPDVEATTLTINRTTKTFNYNLADLTNFNGDQRNPDDFENTFKMSLATVGCRGAATMTAKDANNAAVNLLDSTGTEVANIATGYLGQPAVRKFTVARYTPALPVGFHNTLQITNGTGVDVTLRFVDVTPSSTRGFDDDVQFRITSDANDFTAHPNPASHASPPGTILADTQTADNDFRAHRTGNAVHYYYGRTIDGQQVFSRWSDRPEMAQPDATPRDYALPSGGAMQISLYNDGGPAAALMSIALLPANDPLATLELSTLVGTSTLHVIETIDWLSDTPKDAATAKLRVTGSTSPKTPTPQSLNFDATSNSGLVPFI